MNKENENKLVRDFPSLYRGIEKSPAETCMCWGFEVGDGWFDLIYKLSEDLMKCEGASEIEVTQVKEKYGTLRYYTNTSTDEIDDLISKAEDDSGEICEECTKPGKVEESSTSWYKCMCEDCRKANDERMAEVYSKTYTPPTCKELGSITKLTKAKHPGAADGKKSKL